ncbi:unnamed protein product [Ilex paraguariensis]|uniref:protein-serine/threonine phosphatase n=1 Tax=Ilex paraguariensis TaxID=185542 RepID=A0ABC8QZS9_9AQUA
MAKAMVRSIVSVGGVGVFLLLLLVMLLLILLIVFIAFKCKPWRFVFGTSRTGTIKVDDIERRLVSEDLNLVQNQSNEFARNYALEGAYQLKQAGFNSSRKQGLAYKQRPPSTTPQLTHSDSFVLDISDPSEDILVGQTLKLPLLTNQADQHKHERKEDLKYSSKSGVDNYCRPKSAGSAGSILTLEVISGPSCGLRCSIQSSNISRLPLTLGRVSPSDVLVNDSEVSGKHALINWNLNKLKWELVDMGSLNGTLLNSQSVHHSHSGHRQWGDPIELTNGDIITLGTTSKICVQITSQKEYQIPFGVCVTSDPMALRRGGKKLPMEDVCYYKWPLPGADQFGVFGICDGHGGAGAATSVGKIMPEMVASILADSFRREGILSQCDASDVLREVFSQTEASLNHYYEVVTQLGFTSTGCTATMLLVWADGHENFFAQCANVGDSACIVKYVLVLSLLHLLANQCKLSSVFGHY